MHLLVPEARVPVLAEADVVVCGGGCGGVAAAVAAARHGASVVLVERWPTVGGMATNGLVNGWHRSDCHRIVINGLVEESAQRAARHGWIAQVGNCPREPLTHWFDPEGMRIVWQRMLDEAGVRTFCHLGAGDPVLEDGRIRAVLCDTKQGRRAVVGRIFLDATGDGDVAAKAGVSFDVGRASDGRVQGMTLMFALRGLDTATLRAVPRERVAQLIDRMVALRDEGRFPPFNVGNMRGLLGGWGVTDHSLWNVLPVAGDPLDEEALTRLTALARERLVRYLEFLREEMPGMGGARIAQTAFALGVRESRRSHGRKTLTAAMVLGAAKQPDAVGHGIWMIDIHDPAGSGHTTWAERTQCGTLQPGTSYHIPLGMALCDQVPNLAVACRAASATHEALASFRVQTHVMALAQGVGTCAALALERGVDLASVDLCMLQAALRSDGVHLENVPATTMDR